MPLHPAGVRPSIKATRRHSKDCGFCRIHRGPEFMAVEHQHHLRGSVTNSFVAIHERMNGDERKTETSGFIEERRIKILASKCLARLAQCSFLQIKISQSW